MEQPFRKSSNCYIRDSKSIYYMAVLLFSGIPCHKNHMIKRVITPARLPIVLIRLLIATKMAGDFGAGSFIFKIDPAFNFEMNDKVQIDAREKGRS